MCPAPRQHRFATLFFFSYISSPLAATLPPPPPVPRRACQPIPIRTPHPAREMGNGLYGLTASEGGVLRVTSRPPPQPLPKRPSPAPPFLRHEQVDGI